MRQTLLLMLLGTGLSAFADDGFSSLLGSGLRGWKALDPAKANDWLIAHSVSLSPTDPKLFRLFIAPAPPPGARSILVNGRAGKTVNLVTEGTYGDIEALIEFAVPQGSNSGLYFQGLYEIQILDSWGKKEVAFSDCGGVYARYLDGKVVGGAPPRVNASRAPGEWQTFEVRFRVPRFDGSGIKIRNARFERVVHNGVTIHENVELDGPTRASMTTPEGPRGPLMLQGDHGPVAFREIRIRALK